MERVVFLLEDSTRVSCMLNPASILLHRRAGIAPRASGAESVAAWHLTEDPILCTGGGTTEFVLELLFDLAIAGSTVSTEDVRELTAPLWRLTESAVDAYNRPRLPVARLIWGKTWNVPGIVAEVAERLEAFSESGAPRRSVMTMRFVRVNDDDDRPRGVAAMSRSELKAMEQVRLDAIRGPVRPDSTAATVSDRVLGGRPDVIAARTYGSETMWRLVLAPNGILDPFEDLTGRSLTLLPRAALGTLDE